MNKRAVEKILKILNERHWYVGVMESCTGGAIMNSITNIPGCSDVFGGGLVVYSDEAKIKAGVGAKLIEKFGVYSFRVAEEMVKNTKGEVGIGVTGQLPGMVYMAVRINDKIISEKIEVENKAINKVRARIKMKGEVVGRVMKIILENLT